MVEREQNHTDSLETVADAIGAPVGDVAEVLELMTEKKVLAHGVKRRTLLDGVLETGVEPLTPETRGSCWSSGLPFVYPLYDSTFFHWSGEKNRDEPEVAEMDIVFVPFDRLREYKCRPTTLGDLKTELNEYIPDRQYVVAQTVPVEAMTIVQVRLKHDSKGGREIGQKVEQLMLYAIRDALKKDVPGGEVIRVYEEMGPSE